MRWTQIFSTPLLGDRHGVRLRVHIAQRWLAIIGQLITVLAIELFWHISLPVALISLVIFASVCVNVWLTLHYPRAHILTDREALLFFAYDCLQLGLLLYLTGGLGNPFALLVLAPVALAATVLRAQTVLLLGLLAGLIVTSLRLIYLPLAWEGVIIPELYLDGVWAGIMLSLLFIPGFIWRVSHERRRMTRALEAAEQALARETRLSALDGLAAAAAHQLGTPLGTITLIASELRQAQDLQDDMREDIQTLYEQSQRCRDILASLAREPGQGDQLMTRLSLRDVLVQTLRESDHHGKSVSFDIMGTAPEPAIPRHAEIIYGLGNLLENAAEFAAHAVRLTAEMDEDQITIRVRDDGPGFPPDILTRLGEPYTTERGGRQKSGMGLGFFIAKTLLERRGGKLQVTNILAQSVDRHRKFLGAEVSITWSRAALEAGDGGDLGADILTAFDTEGRKIIIH